MASAGKFDTTAGRQAVREALEELRGFFQEFQTKGDTKLLHNRLGFWKGRTVQAIEENIAPNVAEAFREISLTPRWVQSETYEDVIGHHRSFLVALHESLANHPEAIRRVDQATHQLSPHRKHALKPPEKVTLAWLFQHLPLRGWATLIGLLLASFLLGLRLGQVPEAVRLLNYLLHR